MKRYFGVCEFCGGETSSQYKSTLKRFCSHACSNKYKWKYLRPRAEYVNVSCKECGKILEIPKRDHRLKTKKQDTFFCSKLCESKYRQKQHTDCICVVCGKSFWRGRSRYNLCSTECQTMHRRYLAYKRFYDDDIDLQSFLILYSHENPFAWASDPKKYLKIYTETNREELNRKRVKYRHSNAVIDFRIYVHQRIQGSYRHKRDFQDDIKDIVGCSIDAFRSHIRSLFTSGMDESNYGKWELDHIIPISSAKTVDEVKVLSHYTNYQPLWAEDNRRKGTKLPTVKTDFYCEKTTDSSC